MLARLLLCAIRLYQRAVSPLLGPVCRFHPSCSHYAAGCIQMHGVLRGSWLALKRLGRCHPFNPGGYDPVPLPRRDHPGQPTPSSVPPPESARAVLTGEHGT